MAADPLMDRLASLLFGGRRLPVVLQAEVAECGLACVAMVARYHGADVDLIALRRRYPISAKGTSLRDVLAAAQKLGLGGRGLRLEHTQLRELTLPAVLHWGMNHFVVLRSVSRDGTAVLHDPAEGLRRCPPLELARCFTGIALELSPASGFAPVRDRRRLRARALWGQVGGVGRALAQSVLLTAVLQAALLAGPFYMQLAVDEAISHGDAAMLGSFATGFLVLAAIRFGAEWMRARVLAAFGAVLGFEMLAKLFHHMLRLPLDFFERRNVGDLVSRFGSVRPVRDAVADWAVAAAVDGVMALLLLAAMLAYSPALSGIALAALALNAAIRLSTLSLLRTREEEAVSAQAREQGAFIETVRGLQSIKIAGRETDRESVWRNFAAEAAGRLARAERMRGGLLAVADGIYSAETVAIVFFGALAVMGGSLSVGMLFAFVAWRQQFLEKATKLLESAVRWRLLDLHLDRIADIAFAEREPGLDPGDWQAAPPQPLFASPLRGGLRLRAVRYRYAPSEPEVLDGIDLTVEPGEFVAITGPSGGGKTTLLKIVLGLLRPTGGEVLVDGVPLDRVGPVAFRAQIGAVMQDDRLLSGTIAENVTFFDPRPDWGFMRDCARAAAIDADVMDMAMNYNTMIGDMGSALSGGQRQRLLLARALYRRPRMLFMDEGTSAMDLAGERQINQALTVLRITRLVIAHRPDTVAAADRVVVLQHGRLERDLRQAARTEPAHP